MSKSAKAELNVRYQFLDGRGLHQKSSQISFEVCDNVASFVIEGSLALAAWKEPWRVAIKF